MDGCLVIIHPLFFSHIGVVMRSMINLKPAGDGNLSNNKCGSIAITAFHYNERLYAMEPHLLLERFPPPAGFKPPSSRSAGKH